MLEHFVLPAWGSRPITEIRRSDVTALLDAVEEKRSAVLAVIRKMFNWRAARDERSQSSRARHGSHEPHRASPRPDLVGRGDRLWLRPADIHLTIWVR
jgi:hypothetical protein